MLISEMIHKLTSISRQVGDINVVTNKTNEIMNIAVVKNEFGHYAVIQDYTDIKDQLA